ncbi:MAG: outer membrane beta-barrel protein [Akkermansia sp.]|nr:outer membrane beta-barrel protein [Akkermansia sp.]MBQ2814771.1 outer membrane beta-barrel protein [Akkermansia sp.]
MKKLLSLASILAVLAGTASAAPYYLPTPQSGALTSYDMQPVYAIDALYSIGDDDMVDTYGVRGSFNLYNDAEGTFRHQFNISVGYEMGDETISAYDVEVWQVPVMGGYDLNIELIDDVFLTVGGKAGYTFGEFEIDKVDSNGFNGFTFRVGGGIKIQCSESTYVRAGYEFGRSYIHEEGESTFGQHIISLGVGCQF